MSSRWSALLVWGLAAAALVYWGLRLGARPLSVPTHAQVVGNEPLLVGDLTRLLGAAPVKAVEPAAVAPDVASRFRLTGVVATRSAREPAGPPTAGLALISVDGKPPQAYRVGDTLDQRLVLQSVGLRTASVGPLGAGSGFVLTLPPPTPAATGVPPGMVSGIPVPPPPMGQEVVPGMQPGAPPAMSISAVPPPMIGQNPAVLSRPGANPPAPMTEPPGAQPTFPPPGAADLKRRNFTQ